MESSSDELDIFFNFEKETIKDEKSECKLLFKIETQKDITTF